MPSPAAAAGPVTIFPLPCNEHDGPLHSVQRTVIRIHIFAGLTRVSIALSHRAGLDRTNDALCCWGVVTDDLSRTVRSVTRRRRTGVEATSTLATTVTSELWCTILVLERVTKCGKGWLRLLVLVPSPKAVESRET